MITNSCGSSVFFPLTRHLLKGFFYPRTLWIYGQHPAYDSVHCVLIKYLLHLSVRLCAAPVMGMLSKCSHLKFYWKSIKLSGCNQRCVRQLYYYYYYY